MCPDNSSWPGGERPGPPAPNLVPPAISLSAATLAVGGAVALVATAPSRTPSVVEPSGDVPTAGAQRGEPGGAAEHEGRPADAEQTPDDPGATGGTGPVSLTGSWVGEYSHEGASLGLSFELQQDDQQITGELKVADPEDGVLWHGGELSGTRTDDHVVMSSTFGSSYDLAVTGSQLTGSAVFPGADLPEGPVSALTVTVTARRS